MEVDQNNQGFRLGDEQRLDWLRLIRSQNVGPRTFRALINHYGGARSALAALPSLARRGGADAAMKICSLAEAEREMAAANKNTIVLVTSGGGVDMNAWIRRVPALLEVWYPGQEGGKAVAEILFGDVNPSGRLPASLERHWEDNPAHESYYPAAGTTRVSYKEGVFVGYRGYEHTGTKPLFPFGYGLSYTSFQYANVAIQPADANAKSDGISAPLFQISFDVTNTGSRAGADVAQIYVAEPHAKVPRPAKELKGFARIELKPGETKTSTVTLSGRSFSYYDAEAKQWRADPGEFQILVGRSSQDIVLRGSLTLSAASAASANNK